MVDSLNVYDSFKTDMFNKESARQGNLRVESSRLIRVPLGFLVGESLLYILP